MKKVLLSTIACATLALAANSDYKYEITPLIGGVVTEGNLDLDRNYANAGLSLGFNQFDSFIDQVELGFLRSIEDVDYKDGSRSDTGITRIFTNLVKEYPLTADASLYTLVGAGVEIFDNENAGNENGLFGNYGAGIKYKIADELSLKFDVRHLIEVDHGDNNLLYTLGFSVPFGEVAKAAPVVETPAPVVETPAPVAAPKDTDGDGVIDNLDECPDTMKGAKVDAVGCMTLINLNINFDTDKSVIKDSYNSRVAEFAKMMKANPKLKASIEAHTDSVGSNAYNQKLSERRAASTVKALTDLGVDSTKIKAVGYGETRPVATNATVEGRAENRRVEAVMVK
ncbi:MAG: OmpA family protein [Arcobacter sp.]|jgi:OOP family OmpA-OmpF porin|uniref:Outer membrane fibronectin-binding protein n=1 Tax=Arcobacter defluvii TaxID=873191 RepID=A0AAE7E5C8_9BACT|nr:MULTISPECIES: OmpA family protein [Arcobacter]MDY3199578.1 OmpA family protein [Arcobacter sp.]QKF76685.1 outer membrane fibronectin-binding protein [Arcobacter defluvii]RXI34830.1 OmpA family protein [Arcobacter defluvii]BAK72497.1 outer membrane fibronectin-binding protein [Arcobacter sp. L]